MPKIPLPHVGIMPKIPLPHVGIMPKIPLITGATAPKAAPTNTPPSDSIGKTYTFIVGWTLMLTLFVFLNKTRLGHVIIYYSLLLIILFILVTEYQQLAPLLNIQTIGELNASMDMGPSTGGAKAVPASSIIGGSVIIPY